MRRLKITAATAAEASAIYCAMRDASGEGASTWPDGSWRGHRISYNGRVWQRGVENPKSIYNPGNKTPDYWKGSTL